MNSKKHIQLIFLVISIGISTIISEQQPAVAQTRIWTSNSGVHQTHANLESFDGKQVILKKENGSLVTVTPEQLSSEDQKFLADHIAATAVVRLDDNKSEQWKSLLRIATQKYTRAGQLITPKVDSSQLLEIANADQHTLHPLASKLILRQLIKDKKEGKESQFGQNFSDAVQISRQATLNSAARQMEAQYFGDEISLLDEATRITKELSPVVQAGLDHQRDAWLLSRQAWIAEGVIAAEVEALMTKDNKKATDTTKLSASNTYYKSKSTSTPFAAYRLSNRTNTILPWCVVVIHIDCKYRTPQAETFHNNFGVLLGRVITGGNVPDFRQRSAATQAYANIDKTYVFFIENWEPKKSVKLVGMRAGELFDTAEKVEIRAYWPGHQQQIEVDLDRHKKILEKKFAPRPRRK